MCSFMPSALSSDVGGSGEFDGDKSGITLQILGKLDDRG